MSARIVLLASYPKSGNTWTRLVLQALMKGGPVALNELNGDFHGFPRRVLFDDIAPINAADLTPDEIDEWLPDVFAQFANEIDAPIFMKTHDAARRTPSGKWFMPPDNVHGVIHLVRHPFDVAVSYAKHMGKDVDWAIDVMGRENEMVTLGRDRLPPPLHEVIGSWSQNVCSWLSGSPYQVTTVRYEDMHESTFPTFQKIVAAVGFVASDARIAMAIDATRFDKLREEERAVGFRERPRASEAFFRSGKPRSWEGLLSDTQRAGIFESHGKVMERLGYKADGSYLPLSEATFS